MTEPFISPIRPDQIPDAARVMAYAFANAPRYTFLLPDDARRHAKLPWYWEATITRLHPLRRSRPRRSRRAGQHRAGCRYLGFTETAQTQCPDSVAVRPVGGARPSRRPGLAAPQGSWPSARLAGATQPVLALEQHRRRPIGTALGSGKRPYQPHAPAHR